MIRCEKTEELYLVFFEGSILQSESNQLKKTLEKIIELNELNIIIDLSGTKHVCSSALGHLVYYYTKMQKYSAKVRLIIIDDDLLELFEITMLNQVFEIYADYESAKNSLKL